MVKVTLPDGAWLPGATGATVAVNVTDCPHTDGFADDTTLVVVWAGFTTCPPASDPLLAKYCALPPYAPETGWFATLSRPGEWLADPATTLIPLVLAESTVKTTWPL